jgi:uncharacterized protein
MRRTPIPAGLFFLLGLVLAGVLWVSRRGGAGTVPLAVFTLVSILLMRALPLGSPPVDALAGRTEAQIRSQVRPLLIYALTWPLLAVPFVLWGRAGVLPVLPGFPAAGWAFSWNFLACKVILLLVPSVAFIVRFRATGRELGLRELRQPWRWLGPLLGASPIYVLGAVVPLVLFASQHGSIVPLGVVAIVPIFVLLAGAFSEEFFYRVLLQTRLESVYGRWNAIAGSAILFGLFHLPLHYASLRIASGGALVSQLVLVVAGILAAQVVAGIFFGYMWSRYRNGWMNVAVHLVYDSIVTILLLSGA